MSQLEDAVAWCRAMLSRAVQAWRMLYPAEKGALIVAAIHGFVLIVRAIGHGEPQGWAVVAGFALLPALLLAVIADALVLRHNVKNLDAAMIKVNQAKPTGAPRVAEVRCHHGDLHRFVYGPDGWAPAGPAPDTQPVMEASQ